MFITSRESAILFSPSTEFALSTAMFPGNAEEIGRTSSSIKRVRVNFGVLSISQPEGGACQRKSPGFVGFCGCFLELRRRAVADCPYNFRYQRHVQPSVVVFTRMMLRLLRLE